MQFATQQAMEGGAPPPSTPTTDHWDVASCEALLEARKAEYAAQQSAAEANSKAREEELEGARSAVSAAAADAAAAVQALATLELRARLHFIHKTCSAAAFRARAPEHLQPEFVGLFSVSVKLQADMGVAFSPSDAVEFVAPGGALAAVGVRVGDVLIGWQGFCLSRSRPEGSPPFFDYKPTGSERERIVLSFERGMWAK